jgi:phospholipase/carboxylesterase
MFSAWQTAEQGASRRAAPGTLGLYIRENDDKASSAEAFLLGNEFAHHHPREDGGLHLVLPPAWQVAAIKKGWAVPHTLAGQPTVSGLTVLIFAPRDAEERDVIRRFIEVSESFARGIER